MCLHLLLSPGCRGKETPTTRSIGLTCGLTWTTSPPTLLRCSAHRECEKHQILSAASFLSVSPRRHLDILRPRLEEKSARRGEIRSHGITWNPSVACVSCSTPEQEMEERKCNYERYRGLVQNDFASSECHQLQCLTSEEAEFNHRVLSHSAWPVCSLLWHVTLPSVGLFCTAVVLWTPCCPPQSPRSSVCTRSTWMSCTAACPNPTKTRRKSTFLFSFFF